MCLFAILTCITYMTQARLEVKNERRFSRVFSLIHLTRKKTVLLSHPIQANLVDEGLVSQSIRRVFEIMFMNFVVKKLGHVRVFVPFCSVFNFLAGSPQSRPWADPQFNPNPTRTRVGILLPAPSRTSFSLPHPPPPHLLPPRSSFLGRWEYFQ